MSWRSASACPCLAALSVSLFESTIAHVTALTVMMPIVAVLWHGDAWLGLIVYLA